MSDNSLQKIYNMSINQVLTSECVGPEWQECQGEDEVPHTGVGLEQSHQREEDIRKEHWVITVER